MIDIILGALCEHRSQAHIDAHGGLKADSLFHMQHGEFPTCKPGTDKASYDDDASRDDSDPGSVPRRDNAGFHCTVFGCG